MEKKMKIHQIRNATLIITFNNVKFLIDPWLMPKDYMQGFDACIHSETRQPRTELPLSIEQIVDVDAVILTHYHPDHWDEFAAKALNKDIPFFVQSADDAETVKKFGFNNVAVIESKIEFSEVSLFKTKGQHGKREIIAPLCEKIGMPYDAMGVVFKSENEKKLYLAGDTIWCNEVKENIDEYNPDIIIVNACGAKTAIGERLIMDADDVKAVAEYVKSSTIIASHMDTVSHLSVTRDDIKKLNLPNVLVPNDNDILEF